MKKIKYIILLSILFLTSKLFSQSISLPDLIGNWKWGYGEKHYTVITFKPDSIYSFTANYNGGLFNKHYKEPKLLFTFDSLHNEYYIKTAYPNTDPKTGRYLKLHKIDPDHFTIQLFKEIEFKYHSFQEIEYHDRSIDTLVRLKDH